MVEYFVLVGITCCTFSEILMDIRIVFISLSDYKLSFSQILRLITDTIIKL